MLEKLIEFANKNYDGHFTILKFTTNYRVCLGTVIDTVSDTNLMAKGKTLDEAISVAIEKNINCYDINKKAQEMAKYDLLDIAFGDSDVDIDEAIHYYERLLENENTSDDKDYYIHSIEQLKKIKEIKKSGGEIILKQRIIENN